MTRGVAPRIPRRPLIWPDILVGVRDALPDSAEAVYIVGGAVRDAWLHRPFHDIDLAVSNQAVWLARQIANRLHGDFFVLDAERDVGRVLLNTPDGRLILDVAHLRGETLEADLQDRDFTINAMAVDLRGDPTLLIDPLDGESDLTEKRLRRCSPESLARDPIRAMRAVRQSIQFGLRIEAETLADVRKVGPALAEVSPERVRDELFKLLALPRPAAALRVADQLRMLRNLFPELERLREVEIESQPAKNARDHVLEMIEALSGMLAVIAYNRTDNTAASFGLGMMAIQLDQFRPQLVQHIEQLWPNDRSHRALLMLAALLHEIGRGLPEAANEPQIEAVSVRLVDQYAVSLRLSNAERERLISDVRWLSMPLRMPDHSPRSIYRFWRQTGESGIDVCLLTLAHQLAGIGSDLDQDGWLHALDRVRVLLEAYFLHFDTVVSPPVLVDGGDIMRHLRLKPGRMIGEILESIREAQVVGEVRTVEDALRFAAHLLER
jgi:tRNA nucleotidyltransferase/poly(A) polymerase